MQFVFFAHIFTTCFVKINMFSPKKSSCIANKNQTEFNVLLGFSSVISENGGNHKANTDPACASLSRSPSYKFLFVHHADSFQAQTLFVLIVSMCSMRALGTSSFWFIFLFFSLRERQSTGRRVSEWWMMLRTARDGQKKRRESDELLFLD